MKKRILAFLLTLAMVLAVSPAMSVSAASERMGTGADQTIDIKVPPSISLEGEWYYVYKIFDLAKVQLGGGQGADEEAGYQYDGPIGGFANFNTSLDIDKSDPPDPLYVQNFKNFLHYYYSADEVFDPNEDARLRWSEDPEFGAIIYLSAADEITLTQELIRWISDNNIAPDFTGEFGPAAYDNTWRIQESGIDGIDLGYYLVVVGGNNVAEAGDVGDGVLGITSIANLVTVDAIVSGAPPVTIRSAKIEYKADAPDLDKKVKHENLDENEQPGAADGWQDFTDIKIGDEVKFQITSKVPNMRGYHFYDFTVYDKLSGGLTYALGTGTAGPGENHPANLTVKIGSATLVEGVDYKVWYSLDNDDYISASPAVLPADYKPGEDLYIAIDFIIFDNLGIGSNYTGRDSRIVYDAPIVINYSATLNDKAIVTRCVAGGPCTCTDVNDCRIGNLNDAWLEYSNNPYDITDGQRDRSPRDRTRERGRTPNRRVRVFTFDLDILKADEKGEPLADATFRLYRVNNGGTFDWDSKTDTATGGFEWIKLDKLDDTRYRRSTKAGAVGEFVTSASGKINIEGLDAGTYYLVEVEAPKGFNKLADPIKVVISYTTSNPTSNLSDFTVLRKLETIINGNLTTVGSITAENKKGLIFPETGGIGTMIFYTVGTLLLLGSGIFLAVRHKMYAVRKRREEELEEAFNAISSYNA